MAVTVLLRLKCERQLGSHDSKFPFVHGIFVWANQGGANRAEEGRTADTREADSFQIDR
jgi:hypothetical protein